MIISIHQPNFIPWIGYFYKVSQSDVFVFLDDVQYTKNSFINRNKIKTASGPVWLTLPVQGGKLSQSIKDTLYFDRLNNVKKVKRSVEMSYAKSPFFKEYFDELCHVLDNDADSVAVYNQRVILWLFEQFGIGTTWKVSSEMSGVTGTGTERLVSICRGLGADSYLSGGGGANYQEEEIFTSNSIRLTYTDFVHPQYAQLFGEFVPYMSAIDLLFNCGPESRQWFVKH